jgi:hypothetical protein
MQGRSLLSESSRHTQRGAVRMAEREHCGGIEQPHPRGRDVEGLNLRPLVYWPDHVAFGIKSAVVDNETRPCCCVLGIERIGRLKSGTGDSQVQVNGVGIGELEVQTIENILLISLGMDDGKLRRIEETAAVQYVGRDKVTPFLASVTEIKASLDVPKLP